MSGKRLCPAATSGKGIASFRSESGSLLEGGEIN